MPYVNVNAHYFNVPAPQFEAPNCASADTDTFFAPPRNPEVKQARRVCAVCPHVVECALHGLEHEEYGVWGGLSEQDRAAMECEKRSPGIWRRRSPKAREEVRARLRKAGVSDDKIAAIEKLWTVRKFQIEQERGDDLTEREAS